MVFCQYLWRFYIGCNTFQQSEILSVVTIGFLYPFATTSVIFTIFIYLLSDLTLYSNTSMIGVSETDAME